MILAHQKLLTLEKICNQIERKEKIVCLRIHKSSVQKLDQMQISLFRHGIKFRNNIGQFTKSDAIKNKSWCANFTATLNKVHDDLDSCLINNR